MSNFIHPFLSKTEAGLYEFEAHMFNEVLRKFSRNEKPSGPFTPHVIFTRIKKPKGGK